MKKLLSVLLAFFMVFALVGCSNNEDDGTLTLVKQQNVLKWLNCCFFYVKLLFFCAVWMLYGVVYDGIIS